MNNDLYKLNEVKSLSQIVMEKIQELIYKGVIKPGERLVQTDLAERFNVSRVAIRDALHNLSQTGLIEKTSSGGAIVRALSEEDINNIAWLRMAIEPEIASKACLNIGTSGIEYMEQIIHVQEQLNSYNDFIGYLRADWDFHNAYYEYANNDLAIQFLEKLWNRSSQARGMIFINEAWGHDWVGRSILGHKRMVVNIKCRDVNEIVKTIQNNINSAQVEQLEWFRHINA
ncbi:MAG: GntR family transcriptional regulator [Sphaerochaetaceae bacterium]|nr:GntR family transcriptional regulator [Sphaerochaetaceae bacterium]